MDHDEIRRRAETYISKESDELFRTQVQTLLEKEDWKELQDRFYMDLEFGTAGLRGIIGGGLNRMNLFVVRRATQGLATYVKNTCTEKNPSCVIAYDSRRYSKEFSLEAALVLAANGIKTYLFTSLRPTPELSYAIRELKTQTGIVVTASHNPPAYNGYKAYWSDGAQITPPHDVGIIAEVNKVETIHTMTKEDALSKDLLVYIDKEIDEKYVAMIKSKLFRPELIREKGKSVQMVYTPLHGTGALHFERVMNDIGLNVTSVPEQREPNGEFPTVDYPNPEEGKALTMALDLGRKIKADVVMANDPDADRLGIAVPDAKGDYVLISGNQLGSLLADYILLSMKEKGTLPKKPATIRSIVTTDLQRRIAEYYGATCFECLTGFKWIADLMRRFESDGKGYEFCYGTEESYGFLVENEVRDKDGISAAAMTAEMTLYWRSQGKSLLDRLDDLYKIHGVFVEAGINQYFQGSSGMEVMKNLMKAYRENPPKAFDGIKIVKVRDVGTSQEWNTSDGVKKAIAIPPSNVIQWYLEDGTLVSVRPSGTEPKIKFYILVREEVARSLDDAKTIATKKASAIEAELRASLSAWK